MSTQRFTPEFKEEAVKQVVALVLLLLKLSVNALQLCTRTHLPFSEVRSAKAQVMCVCFSGYAKRMASGIRRRT
ncbi:hypothetical protein [Delftia sp. DS1230]|uniref:hypothetical protein n=1 Tax=Delftia sp. DS1230 TaxID=3153805 RepID=UPI0032D95ABA